MGVGVEVSVGGIRVGIDVSVGGTVGGTAAVVAAGTGAAGASTGALDGSVQAVSRKIKMNEIARKFFIVLTFNPFSIP
jgi:hypothetical protein